MNPVLMVFVDGLGLGPQSEDNPVPGGLVRLAQRTGELTSDRKLPAGQDGAWITGIDARLGVPGLPQSATGQTALLTGVNAAREQGRHVSGYPTRLLKQLLQEQSLFVRLAARACPVAFLNAFRPASLAGIAAGTYRATATTTAALAAGVELRALDDAARGRSVPHDVTGWSLARAGIPVPDLDPQVAGRQAAAVSREHAFTLFEYFMTDVAGHGTDRRLAAEVLDILDRFMDGAASALDCDQTLVLVSDHGNIEDLSVRTHTCNPVPLVVIGPRAEQAVRGCRSLIDVAPAIARIIDGRPLMPGEANPGVSSD